MLKQTKILTISFILFFYTFPVFTENIESSSDDINIARSELLNELIKDHGFDEQYVTNVFNEVKFLPELIDSISRPAEKTKSWKEYRAIFLTPKRIAAGVIFANQHKELLDRVEEELGIPRKILLGILGVETSFGSIQGRYEVVNSLYTLAVGYPPRSKFFRQELINLFYLCKEQGFSISSIKGSYAGAMGAPQFIASSYRNYAIDGDGDGKINLFDSWDDILMSIGNYLNRNGWDKSKNIMTTILLDSETKNQLASATLKPESNAKELISLGIALDLTLEQNQKAQIIYLKGEEDEKIAVVGLHNFYVITTYNRNVMYALAVIELGESIENILSRNVF
tara:strand:+ start:329 stop:1345 length:1017 start_codon:yes stop_codon:yes gene_type:complete